MTRRADRAQYGDLRLSLQERSRSWLESPARRERRPSSRRLRRQPIERRAPAQYCCLRLRLEGMVRIAIMGSGGVGGYFGARLVKGGADVHFVARGAHLAAMRERGLAIEGGPAPLHLPKVNVTDDPRTIGPVDMVMFCVKLWDTESAARQLLPIMTPGTGVISFQNGVQKDDMLRPIFGDQALMGGVAYVGTHIGRPGVIAQTGSVERLVFGEYHGGVPHASRRFTRPASAAASTLRSATMSAARSGRNTWRWWRCPAQPPPSARPSGRSARIRSRGNSCSTSRARWVAVGRAHGVALPADYAEQRIPFFYGWPPEMTTSMHHDLQQGKRLELRWLSGGVVDLGAEVGVPTPVNRAVRDMLVLYAEGSAGLEPAPAARQK